MWTLGYYLAAIRGFIEIVLENKSPMKNNKKEMSGKKFQGKFSKKYYTD